MANEVQHIANNGVWMHEVPLLDPEQTETISDTLLPSVQRYGDTTSGDALDNEIDNPWPYPTFSSVIALEVGDRIPRMLGYNEDEEGKSPGHIFKHSIWMH